jgi:hypothetical protein
VEKTEERKRLADFVFLQVPDEVPDETGRAGRDLVPCFLYPALAEDTLSGLRRRHDRLRRMGLGHRDETHGGRIAAGLDSGLRDLPLHGGQLVGDLGH